MISLTVDIRSAEVEQLFQNLRARATNLRSVNRGIAEELRFETEQQFGKQGDPSWKPLATSTIARRRKAGTWPGRILQVEGRLASSVQATWDDRSARLTSNLPYAAIQQLGGRAGRNRSATIPARPYLPFTGTDEDAKLTPAATRAILSLLREHFAVADQ